MTFDHPSVAALAAFIASQMGAGGVAQAHMGEEFDSATAELTETVKDVRPDCKANRSAMKRSLRLLLTDKSDDHGCKLLPAYVSACSSLLVASHDISMQSHLEHLHAM